MTIGNALYDHGRDAFLNALIPWTSGTVSAAAVVIAGGGTIYTPDLANHQFLSDIPSAAIAATVTNLAGKGSSAGTATLTNFSFAGVPVGPQIGAVIFYEDTGTPTTSRLIAYVDDAAGLPVTPSGGNVDIAIDPTDGLFTL
jgi:hypothetical protein